MATATWNVSKDARIADNGGTSLGAGASDFNPTGLYSGFLYRTLLGFSYSFSGIVSITSATLYMKSSTQYYVGFGSSPSCQARRLSSSWSEGTAVSMSGSNAVEWSNQPGVTGSESSATTMTETELTWDTINITTIIQEAFAANSFYGLRIYASSESDASDVWEMCAREYGTSHDPYITVVYETNTAPTAPTSLSPTADTCIQNLTPTFKATFNDPDAGEVMANYQINVYEDNGTTLKWDSGAIAGSTVNKVYNGPALTGNTFYKWTVRAQDDGGLWGPYQSTLSRFKVNSVPNAPSLSLVQSPTTDITTLTPTFSITHNDPDASDSLMSAYRLYVWSAAWVGIWDTGYVSVTATATKQVVYAGPALSWNSKYYWSAYTYDSNGATYGNWGSQPSFTTHKTGVPITLDPTGGETVSLDGGGLPKPTFTGARATTSDLLTSVTIKVFASTNLVSPLWTYGPSGTGVTSTGFSILYAGGTLSYGTSYQWQAQVVSSIGGTSDWSSLQSFVTPASGSITMTAPVSPVADTTPDFTFGRTAAFNAWNLIVYASDGTTVRWDSGTQTMTSGSTKTITYATGGTINQATLTFGLQYKWKVRVSADSGSTWGAGFSGLVAFTMDSAGVPTLNRPGSSEWLGTPRVVDAFDNITSITNGANLTATAEGTIYVSGRGSVKYTGTFSGTQVAYRTLGTAVDLSDYGLLTPIKIRSYISSLTSVTAIRVRFASTGGPATNYAEYTITPTGTSAWEQKTVTKGSPAATAGTINWADIKYIGIVGIYAASVGPTIYIDDLYLDATAPAFEGTTFGGETISTYSIRVTTDAAGTNDVWEYLLQSGSGTTFSKLYAGPALTLGSTYYWQASYVKSSGAPGGYSSLIPFTLNSAPIVPTALVPVSGAVIANSLVPVFYSTFNDNQKVSRADFPVRYEVEVIRNSDSVSVYTLLKDSGLTAGTNSAYDGESGVLKRTGAANPIAYETQYSYRVRYTDSMGAAGSWSSYTIFKPSQSPTVAISQPVAASTLTSPALTVTWAQSSAGGKAQNSYRLYVWNADNSTLAYDSGRIYTSTASYVYPAGTLINNTDYEFRVMTWDTDGLASAWDNHAVHTTWEGPDPISGFLASADELYSSAKLEWQQSNLATNVFRKYTIYRKRSVDSVWSVLTEIPSITILSYSDYLTAYGVPYDYKITQWKIVVGDADLESGDSDLGTEALESDVWYIVGADRNPSHIFELPVVAAPFSEPVQQEVFEPLGTTRKVIIRGKVMGAEGSMQCKWSSEERVTAVEQVTYIKSNQGPHILKSPFGDVWQVEFGGPTKGYEIGGHIAVALTWTEVA